MSWCRTARRRITICGPPSPSRGPNGGRDAAIDLDGFFGLHPSLAPLKPMFDAQHLAIVDAVGSPDPTRSHFDAQDYMESGTPGSEGHRQRLDEPRAAQSAGQGIAGARRFAGRQAFARDARAGAGAGAAEHRRFPSAR